MKNKKNTKRNIVLNILIIIFTITFAFSVYKLWEINNNYAEEAKIHEEVLEFKPEDDNVWEFVPPPSPPATSETGQEPPEDWVPPVVNPSILDMQNNVNSDVVGWINIPGTQVDYPFVKKEPEDKNDFYLHRDVYKKYLFAGTLFMDYRCSRDFSVFNTIIYGHNMKNGSMFGTLKNFKDKKFFDGYKMAKIYLPNETYLLEIFAYVLTTDRDSTIYGTISASGEESVTQYIDYVKDKATHYRELNITSNDKIITLSTCTNGAENERIVILARIVTQQNSVG